MADHIDTPLADLRLKDLEPRSRIAPDFRFYELSRSELADRLGIDNSLPGDTELRAAVNLTRQVMQPIRDAHGRFSPNSVYRCQVLERVLKRRPPDWISVSPHTQGWACDLEIPGIPTLELAHLVAATLTEYDQIVCECYDPQVGPSSGWVHIALRPPGFGKNRKQQQSFIRDSRTGRWVHLRGFVERVP
jgi:hypothetical protein